MLKYQCNTVSTVKTVILCNNDNILFCYKMSPVLFYTTKNRSIKITIATI